MAGLSVAGALDRCQTFDQPLDLDALARLDVHRESDRVHIDELLAEVQLREDKADLARALAGSLAGSSSPSNLCRARLLQAEDQVDRLQARVQWMEESRSWRMTAPLRKAVAGARRMRQQSWLNRD